MSTRAQLERREPAYGIPLLIGKKTRIAAACVGLTVLLFELIVYVPIAVVQRASIEGFNYMADTLMFCGALLMVAGAMPREIQGPAPENTSSAYFSDSAQR